MKSNSLQTADVEITHKFLNEEGTQTIRTAKALDAKEPVKLNIDANITSVSTFLKKRKEVDVPQSHVLVNREAGTIELVVNEIDPFFKGSVRGSLKLTEDLKSWQINTNEAWETDLLAAHIKMNRHCFTSKETAMKLHSDMKNFKAKVNQEIEKKSDDRANYNQLRQQAVDTNLPEKFILDIPVFKGEEQLSFTVEINIHPQSLECILVSPELKEYMEEQTNRIIDRELKEIENVSPDLVLIEC